MSAVDTYRDALFGNPPSPTHEPSREGSLAAFTELAQQVTALTSGVLLYETKAAMDADTTQPDGSQARVWGDANPANNTYYLSDGGVWSVDDDFIALLTGLFQPFIDQAEDAADAAALSAADALAAASSVFVSSYSHEFSQNDRVAIMTANGGMITTTMTVATGTINNLVDGGVANTDADAVNFGTGQDMTGKIPFQFDFPKGRSLIIDECQILNSGTQSYGTGKPQLKKADGTWVDAGTDAAVGGATTVTRSVSSPDKGGYVGFRIFNSSGSTGAGRMLEVKLKLANGSLDGLSRIPTNGARGTVPMQGAFTNDIVSAEPIDYNGAAQSGAGLLAEYFFNERTGEMVYDQTGNKNHIDFGASHRSTYGGTFGVNYVWTERGLLLRKAMIQTPSLTSTKTIVAVYVPLREDGSTVQWNVSSSTALNSNHARMAVGGGTQSTQTVHVGHGGESIVPLYRDSSGGNGYAVSRGGPLMVISESGSAITGNLGLGGQCNVTADTLRSTEMTCVYYAVYSGTLTSDQRTAIRRALRRSLAIRGIYFDWRDCPFYHAGAFNIGQSNTGNLSISPAGLSAQNIADLAYTPSTMIWCAGRRDEAAGMARPQQYRVGFNSFPGFRALGMGYEAGMALAHQKANATTRRDLAICKVGAGSSNVSDNTALSWNVAVNPGTGMLGYALKTWRDGEQDLLNRGQGLKLFAVNTQNGEQEANNTGVANGNPATYQANMQGIWDKLKEQLPFFGLKMNVGELFPYDTGQSNYTMAGVDAVRAAQAAFVAANPTDTALITSAAGLKQADKLHITADNSVIRGETQVYPAQGIPA